MVLAGSGDLVVTHVFADPNRLVLLVTKMEG